MLNFKNSRRDCPPPVMEVSLSYSFGCQNLRPLAILLFLLAGARVTRQDVISEHPDSGQDYLRGSCSQEQSGPCAASLVLLLLVVLALAHKIGEPEGADPLCGCSRSLTILVQVSVVGHPSLCKLRLRRCENPQVTGIRGFCYSYCMFTIVSEQDARSASKACR